MKKLLLLTLILTFGIIQAQDGYNLSDETYKEIKKKVNHLDSISARMFADEIVKSVNTEYTFLKVLKYPKRKIYSYYYIPSSIYDSDYKEQMNYGCEACFVVHFNVFYDGSNEDLEIEGTQRFRFHFVGGSYLELFPTWKREFLPSAIKEEALDNFRYRDVVNRTLGVNVSLSKHSGVWELRNRSY